MSDLSRIVQLKKKVEGLRREADKAKGGMDQLLVRLKEECGLSSYRKAKRLLRRLAREEEALERKAEKLMKEFTARYGDVL